MWTQRDQIQAYQFLRRRLVSALVVADANHPISPTRRLVIGGALGLAVTVLVVAGFGISGVLHPPAKSDWRRGGQVIVEKETGTRFVLGQDGQLHPVLNYASARLLAGGDGSKTVDVKAGTLAAVPRGAALGITGAPDSLPMPGRLVDGPWTACTHTPASRPEAAAPVATLILGPHSAGAPVGAGQGLVVRVPSGERFLLADGRRFPIDGAAAQAALGYDAVPPLTVSPAFITALPTGRDLRLIGVSGAGAQGVTIGGLPTRVGQVLQMGTAGTPMHYYLVRADGLAAVTQTEANLALWNPANRAAYGAATPAARIVYAYDVAAAPRSATPPDTGYPQAVPSPVTVARTSAVCAEGNGLAGASLFVSPDLPLPPGASATVTAAAPGRLVADQVYVPPAEGALVTVTQSPDATPGTVYLVTDTGRRYPVSDANAVSALGYGSASPARVAPSVLSLLPTGVALDPVAAQQVVTQR